MKQYSLRCFLLIHSEDRDKATDIADEVVDALDKNPPLVPGFYGFSFEEQLEDGEEEADEDA